MTKKERLDTLLVARNLAQDQSHAQRLVMAGQVRVNGQVALKPATQVPLEANLSVDLGPRFVSRGGEKLEAALQAFAIHPQGLVCADVGASTGGFSDCLLQYGAARVYAIDVGSGILDWKLRQDERVVVMEATNARQVAQLPETADLVVIDASFISLKVLLPVVRSWLKPEVGEVVALIKPQFEASRAQVSRGKGVIRDQTIHHQVLVEILQAAQASGFTARGLIRSPLLGPKGNAEFLAWFTLGKDEGKANVDLIEALFSE